MKDGKAQYNAAERRKYSFEVLNEKGHVSVAELSEHFGVSEVTIRKDLQYLEERNMLLRTHGGAMRLDYLVSEQSLEEKGQRYQEQKALIGRAAAALVEDGDSLILDAGTTVLQVARHLRGKRNLTILTSSITVASEVMRIPDAELIMLGGLVRSNSAAVVGHYAEQMVGDHSFRKLFLAVDGFDVDRGLTTTHTMEAHLNRIMIEAAMQTIAVFDSSKFGRRGLCTICGIESIDTIVTDSVPDNIRRRLEDSGLTVVTA
ncbi:MAG TPA: transcriptional repressor AgaR [Rhodothermales bacterium]